MIGRRIQQSIETSLQHFPAVGLVGPRQSGKTTLAKVIAGQFDRPVVYLDLEDPQDLQKLDNGQLYLEQFTDRLIILDEAQRRPEIFSLLRSLIDKDRRPGRFMILGSASPALKRQAAESLAGRIVYHELSPLTLDEVGPDQPNINTLWQRGGYPDSYLAATDELSVTWRNNFIQTHLERDIPALGIRIPSTTLRRFWTMLGHCHGQLWNASRLGQNLGVDSKTARRYLDLLEETYMLRQLQPYFANIKKRLVKSPKVYIRDPGLLHCLLRIHNQEDLMGNPILGVSWEGYCVEQIIALMPSHFDFGFFRTQSGAEVDLVLCRGLKVEVAVEIKYSLTPKLTRSNLMAIQELQPDRTWIVYPGQESYPIKETIRTLPVAQLDQLFR